MGERDWQRSGCIFGAVAAATLLALPPARCAAQETTASSEPATSASSEPATSASSEHTSEARQHYEQGAALFDAENYEGALAELSRAYELLEGSAVQAELLYTIGQCYERLFRYDRAFEYYRRYLEAADAGEDADAIRARMSALESLLATVRVTTNVAHAEVWVDERLAGDAPGDVMVPGGRHTIELRAPGYLPARREVQVVARAVDEENIAMEEVPDQLGLDPLWFALSTGVAVALAGVGAGFGGYAVDLWNGANGHATDEDQRRVDEAAMTADILFAAAGAFAITAATLAFFTQWSSPPRPGDTAVAIVPMRGGGSVSLTGRF